MADTETALLKDEGEAKASRKHAGVLSLEVQISESTFSLS